MGSMRARRARGLSEYLADRKAQIAHRKSVQRERSVAGTEVAVEKRHSRSEALRQLLEDRSERSRLAAELARVERNAQPRGVDRVPERFQGLAPTVTQLVAHEDDNYATRRRQVQATGRKMRPGTNQPAHNPHRAARKRGKRRRAGA